MERRRFLLTASLTLAAPRVMAGSRRRIVIKKSERSMSLEVDGRAARQFEVALGLAPLGDKERMGDRRTPEGEFFVAMKNPRSDYHRFIGLSYPMPPHARRGRELGIVDDEVVDRVIEATKARRAPPQTTALGGFVGIHGGGAGSDWTYGCIAVSDEEVEWLFDRVRFGDRIVVLP